MHVDEGKRFSTYAAYANTQFSTLCLRLRVIDVICNSNEFQKFPFSEIFPFENGYENLISKCLYPNKMSGTKN